MSDFAIVARVASAEVGELLRRIIRETVGSRVSTRASGLAVAALATGLTVLLTLQALEVGRQLGAGYGPGLVASILSSGTRPVRMVSSASKSHRWPLKATAVLGEPLWKYLASLLYILAWHAPSGLRWEYAW